MSPPVSSAKNSSNQIKPQISSDNEYSDSERKCIIRKEKASEDFQSSQTRIDKKLSPDPGKKQVFYSAKCALSRLGIDKKLRICASLRQAVSVNFSDFYLLTLQSNSQAGCLWTRSPISWVMTRYVRVIFLYSLGVVPLNVLAFCLNAGFSLLLVCPRLFM